MSIKDNKTLVFTDTDNSGIIHVANIKGGVGKSTVATNLAAAFSKRGPTLLIDLDVQGSATHALGKNPSDFNFSSWEMFRHRFSGGEALSDLPLNTATGKIKGYIRQMESSLFPQIVGKGEVTSLAIKIQSCFDLIPANSDLFRHINGFYLENFLFNLQLCRNYYKYIILDTPSVWNRLTRALYFNSDLNLVPVTLNALSTKSLRDYLINIKKLAQKEPGIRIRIVKNEVFGQQGSKLKGKTRTMNENRRFLESLCEQVVIRNSSGVSLLPQSIMFDLEIPESAIVRNAQDEGMSVQEFHQYSAVSKAFERLSKGVQYVLNNPVRGKRSFWDAYKDYFYMGARAFAAVVFIVVVFGNMRVLPEAVPRPIAPQQLINIEDNFVEHTFSQGESIFRLAKYAICYFRAVVPSASDVNAYAAEVIDIYNHTRLPNEQKVENYNSIPKGIKIKFYPPSNIINPRENQLIPVYRYFTKYVKDPYAYVTGDWCERGTGGGTPHYGFDVAGTLGSEIISPIDGVAYIRNSATAGRTLGVVNGNMVLFFSHMDKRYFSSGDKVEKGDVVGTVGMTGKTSGPHVHFGYGVRAPTGDGVSFGNYHYKLTDPKLFFYREHYLSAM